MKSTVLKLCAVAVLLVCALSVKAVMLGGAKVVTLQTAGPLFGPVSQAFTSSGASTLPVGGKDYTLQNVHYFENKQWVVANIKGLDDTVSDGMIVLQTKNGEYTVALGPGTAFPTTSTESIPSDVSVYLNSLGATYVPVEE